MKPRLDKLSSVGAEIIGLLVMFAGHAAFSAAEVPPPMDVRGAFLYVINSGSADISAFRIDPQNGALTLLTGSPFKAGEAPYSAAADPKGTTLFVTNSTPGTITAHRINATNRELTPLSGSPFDATTGALAPARGSPYAAGVGPIFAVISGR